MKRRRWFLEAFVPAFGGVLLGGLLLKLVADRWPSPMTWLVMVPVCVTISVLNTWSRGRA